MINITVISSLVLMLLAQFVLYKYYINKLIKEYTKKTKAWHDTFNQEHQCFNNLTHAYEQQLKTFKTLFENITKAWKGNFEELLKKHKIEMAKAKNMIETLLQQMEEKKEDKKLDNKDVKH